MWCFWFLITYNVLITFEKNKTRNSFFFAYFPSSAINGKQLRTFDQKFCLCKLLVEARYLFVFGQQISFILIYDGHSHFSRKVEELSLKKTCLCKTLSYKDNDLHVNLGFKCSLQTLVSILNRNSGNSVLNRQWFSP